MQVQAMTTDNDDILEVVLARLREIVEDGLRHGFFECAVSCEVVTGKKRRLIIKAGKSHQFTIAENELPPR